MYVWTVAAPLPLLGLSLDGNLSRLDGVLLVAWSAVALAGVVLSAGVREQLAVERRRYALARLLAGLGVLTAGGELLGEGIRRVVQGFGVSETLLGNTAVAASVEAEEIARVAAPGRRGRADVALGNVLGTIVHFVAFNAGVIALVRPLPLGEETLELHLPVAVAATALLAALAAVRPSIGRAEGSILLAAYAAYVATAVWIA